MEVLGIDIGSFGIKGAIVDTNLGEIISKKRTTDKLLDTRPHKLIAKMHKIVKEFEWKGPIGCAFPAPIAKGIVRSAARIDEAWVDADADHLFSEITGCPVSVINDTDATGIAEMTFGSGKNMQGTVVILTVGTGVGSSIFRDGVLLPNTELGQMLLKGIPIEDYASNKVRKDEGIKRKDWGKRLQKILEHYEKVVHPDMFILGGQVSKKPEKTMPFIKINTRLKSAHFKNDASIVGAGYYAFKNANRDLF